MREVRSLRTLHLFAGVGGGMLVDLILGHRPVAAVELHPYCCQVLRERAEEGWFPGLHVHELDVRLFDPSPYQGRVDCVHAGWPCQDFSRCGLQLGWDGDRAPLFWEAVRVVRELRPDYVFLENVPAILSRSEWAGPVYAALAEMGYDARWCCLPASACGAPHIRDRWWCLAYAHRERRKEQRTARKPGQEAESARRPGEGLQDADSGGAWHAVALGGLGRMAHGLSDWLDSGWWSREPAFGPVTNQGPVHSRIRALGEAQVPLQAALAWVILGGPVAFPS